MNNNVVHVDFSHRTPAQTLFDILYEEDFEDVVVFGVKDGNLDISHTSVKTAAELVMLLEIAKQRIVKQTMEEFC